MMSIEKHIDAMCSHFMGDIVFDAVERPEDLDLILEFVLDRNEATGFDAPECAVEDLSGLFQMGADGFSDLLSIRLVNDVALARYQLIMLIYGRCLQMARQPVLERDAFRRGLAVCGAVQFETLGQSLQAEAALSPEFCQYLNLDAVRRQLLVAYGHSVPAALGYICGLCGITTGEHICCRVASIYLGGAGLVIRPDVFMSSAPEG